MASEVPWRRNLKSTGGGTAAPNTLTLSSAPSPAANDQKSAATAGATASKGEQPKTTKLQINLKSVKKPDTPIQPNQADKLPPVQLNPVIPESKPANKPPTGKSIPITIVKSSEKPDPEPSKSPPTTTIPIQIKNTTKNDPPTGKTIPVKAESKVKAKQAEPKGNTKSNNKPVVPVPAPKVEPAPENKMPPPPPPPVPPPPPGGPPPPPPPPGGPNAGLPPRAPKPAVAQKLEQLKKAPRKRPDWSTMMKEIETGRKLKKVQCNDRSRPILPKMKSRGKFVFDSEAKPANKADAIHNRLLNEIQSGVKLKKVQCNDRSKPQLGGLRFRRQSSVAETDVQKVSEAIPEQDELAFVMDIDVLRDELQSAKQMLENEIESKHNVEKKNRDQKCQIIAMEAEIETLKAKLGLIPEDEVSMLTRGLDKSDSRTFKHLRKSGSGLWKSPSIVGIKKSKSGITKDILSKPPLPDGKSDQQQQPGQQDEEMNEVNEFEEEISSLKQAVQHARKQAEEMERKYKEAMEKMLVAQGTLEDSEQKRKVLEKKVEALTAGGNKPPPPIVQTAERTTQTEEQILDRMLTRQQSTTDGGEKDGMFTDSEEEDSDMEVDEETVQRKKEEREIKLWENKLKSIKEKQHSSRLERRNLKNLQKKLEAELKEAKKRHKKLQKEVDKMAKMLKEVEKGDDDEDADEDEEEKEETVEEEEEEESEEDESDDEESESETEEEDEESSEEDDEAAGHEDRLGLFGKRVKRRENVLNALRKGNYLLRANIDRLKDDLEEARITYHDLEHELSSVLDDM